MPRRAGLIAVAALAAIGAAVPAGLALLVAYRIIHPVRARPARILQVDADQVVLNRTALTETAGLLGLLYNDEQHLAVLTPDVLPGSDRNVVRRQTQEVPSPPLEIGLGRAVGNVYATAQELDLSLDEVSLTTELGLAPAWIFQAGAADAWLIHVHGSLAEREGALRSVAAVSTTGYPSIVPSLRGDTSAPSAPGGAFMLGQTEWRDVEPALAYAKDHGAKRVVLIGWSAGASVALRLATNSHHRHLIAGVVGISPVLNWTHVIHTAARSSRLPSMIPSLAVRALESRVISRILGAPEPLRFQDLTWTATPVPTLILHTVGDRTVPYSDSIALRDQLPDRVDLPELHAAPHALEWNLAPDLFAELLTTWLARRAASF